MAPDLLPALALLGLGLALAGWVAHRLALPPALGYLAVGLALTPQAIGLGDSLVGAEMASHVAVLFLLFFIGLELDLAKLRKTLGETAGTTFFNILVPALLVSAFLRLLGWSYPQAVSLGIAVSISSTIFGERMSSLHSFGADARRRVLGILVAEDVGAAALLAIVVIMGGQGTGAEAGWLGPALVTGKLVVLLIILLGAALLVLPGLLDRVSRTHTHELVVLTASSIIVAFGALGAWAGSAELGAFVAGVAAAEAGSRFVVRNAVASLREVALAVFLFTSGLAVQVDSVEGSLMLAGVIAALFLAAKLLVNVPASLAAGLDLGASLRTALGLGTLGEFTLILVAAAESSGVAHPDLRPVVIGAMVLLLVLTPLLMKAVPWMVRAANLLPMGIRRQATWLIQGSRRSHGMPAIDPQRQRGALRLLLSNVVLLIAWILLCAWAAPRILDTIPNAHPVLAPALVYGLAFALASPLTFSTYRSYRQLVHLVVGLRPSDRQGAAKVRLRLVDAWVAVTAVVLLVPVTLVVPSALPVLLASLFLAVIIATLAWAQLTRFHHAVEATVTRVLGRDAEAGALLDQVLEKYPWGVGFTAVAIPPSSPVGGQTLEKARLTELTGATVAVLQRRGAEVVNPAPNQVLLPGDTVVLMGDPHQIARAEALIVAHGEALRMTAQSRLATVAEVAVAAGSELAGRTLGDADLQTGTGTLVIGLWPQGAPHPLPFFAQTLVHPGDRLILLGAPLQIERARRLAAPPADPESTP